MKLNEIPPGRYPMNWRSVHLVLVPTVTLLLASCGSRGNSASGPLDSVAEHLGMRQSNSPAVKPVPPLQLAVPIAMPERLDDTDFQNMDPSDLFILGRMAAEKKLYEVAAVAQCWFVQKSGRGQYDLACYLAQTGQIDPAFYWLQLAAIEEGVDTLHTQLDEDLESLRADPRWSQVLRYLQDCNKYFETADVSRTVLILPQDYKKSEAIPAIVWLHGMGSRPEDFVNEESQEYADNLNVALIGVSGTKARGPRSFVWAEEIERDAQRLRAALSEVSDRVTIEKGKVITLGFSQGAQAGLEVAVKYPEEYAGSIVLSPGADFHLQTIKPSPLLAKRGYVVSCGAQEHPGNVQLSAKDAEWLRRNNAKVIHKPYPNVSTHSFPEDFGVRFPEWVAFIFKAQGE